MTSSRKEFIQWLKKTNRKMSRCDCGAPELGHAPDCSYLRSEDDLWDLFLDSIEEEEEREEREEKEFDNEWRREMAMEAGMGIGINAYNDIMFGGLEVEND